MRKSLGNIEINCGETVQIDGQVIIISNPYGGPYELHLNYQYQWWGILLSYGSIRYSTMSGSRSIQDTGMVLFNEDIPLRNLTFSEDFKGYLVGLSDMFIDSLTIDMSISSMWSWFSNGPLIKSLAKEEVNSFRSFIHLMADNIKYPASIINSSVTEEVNRLLMKALLCRLQSKLSKYSNDIQRSHKEELTSDFIKLAYKYGATHRDLDFDAEQLCVTSKYLSAVVTSISGKKSCICLEEATMTQAKYLLRETSYPISQVADQLNFPTPADFTRYFRNREGVNPLKYRNMSISDHLSHSTNDQ